jgi:hypothetical protein
LEGLDEELDIVGANVVVLVNEMVAGPGRLWRNVIVRPRDLMQIGVSEAMVKIDEVVEASSRCYA